MGDGILTQASSNVQESTAGNIPAALAGFGDWYHDFASLGVKVVQRGGIYPVNQRCKQPILLGYLQTALAKAKKKSTDRPSFLEMFCADGFYSCHARHMGAGRVTGIDLDKDAVAQANGMFELLYGEPGNFLLEDVFKFVPKAPVDVLMNCGGLYHVTDPRKLIGGCRGRFGARYMVVQSVVTMETELAD